MPHSSRLGLGCTRRAGFWHLDCAERYRNEQAVGDVMREAFDAATVLRDESWGFSAADQDALAT
jgi:alcohol dehydrogenase (NADP+)